MISVFNRVLNATHQSKIIAPNYFLCFTETSIIKIPGTSKQPAGCNGAVSAAVLGASGTTEEFLAS